MKRVACLLCLMSFLAIPHSAMVQGDFRAVRLNGATTMQERVAAGIVFKP